MDPVIVTYNGVLKLLQNVKVNSSGGPDGIPNYVLHACCETIAHFLVTLFSKSIASGDLPEDWKIANVAPIHKSGPKSNPENYRPISLTSV